MYRYMISQATVEFIILFGVMLIAIIAAVTFSWGEINDVNHMRLSRDANSLLSDVRSKMDTAYIEGDGFSIKLLLPEQINGLTYKINASDNVIYVNISNHIYTTTIMAQNVSGTFRIGENIIRNSDGIIIIE